MPDPTPAQWFPCYAAFTTYTGIVFVTRAITFSHYTGYIRQMSMD